MPSSALAPHSSRLLSPRWNKRRTSTADGANRARLAVRILREVAMRSPGRWRSPPSSHGRRRPRRFGSREHRVRPDFEQCVLDASTHRRRSRATSMSCSGGTHQERNSKRCYQLPALASGPSPRALPPLPVPRPIPPMARRFRSSVAALILLVGINTLRHQPAMRRGFRFLRWQGAAPRATHRQDGDGSADQGTCTTAQCIVASTAAEVVSNPEPLTF